jgi:hypothetical protein
MEKYLLDDPRNSRLESRVLRERAIDVAILLRRRNKELRDKTIQETLKAKKADTDASVAFTDAASVHSHAFEKALRTENLHGDNPASKKALSKMRASKALNDKARDEYDRVNALYKASLKKLLDLINQQDKTGITSEELNYTLENAITCVNLKLEDLRGYDRLMKEFMAALTPAY